MSGQTVVMVLDQDDPKRGEITLLPGTREAARLAEDLIESGVQLERIRIFDATELSMKVQHKPVVSLGADDDGVDFHQPSGASSEEPEQEPVFADDSQAEQPVEEPAMQGGVRFSSLFKPDDI